MRFRTSIGSVAMAAALAVAALPAQAANFAFSYTLPNRFDPPGGTYSTVSGTLTADPTGNPDEYLVSSMTGTWNGATILGLLAPNDGNDNLLYFPSLPSVTFNGIFYLVDQGPVGPDISDLRVHFYISASGYTEDSAAAGFTQSFSLRLIEEEQPGTRVPEPASLALLGMGLLGLGLARRRRAA